jgi:hypothetical protein
MKPVAGMMEFVSLPMEGTVKDVRAMFRKEIGGERRATRYREGLLACREAMQEERDMVITAFIDHKTRSGLVNRKGKGRAA